MMLAVAVEEATAEEEAGLGLAGRLQTEVKERVLAAPVAGAQVGRCQRPPIRRKDPRSLLAPWRPRALVELPTHNQRNLPR